MITTLDYRSIPFVATSRIEKELRCTPTRKEPEFIAWAETLEPGVMFDIGANTGSHSLIAAANGHTVHAFEPPGPTYDRLVQNLDLNSELKVTPHAVLLGDENATVPFSYSSMEPGSACHSLGAGGENVTTLQMHTLDSLLVPLPWPDYLKIDVDGSELRVLVGAHVCLSKGLGSVSSVLMETDDTLPSSSQAEAFLLLRGFEVTERTRHGDGPISNVRFDR